MLHSNIPVYYGWDSETRVPTGIVQAIAAVPPDVGFYQPPCSCEDAPPTVIPSDKRCLRNADNTAWLVVDAADLRRLAYEAEADSIREEARKYEDEASVQRRLGNSEAAAIADAQERRLLKVWIDKKAEIRELYPDPEPVEEQPEGDSEDEEAEPEVNEEGVE